RSAYDGTTALRIAAAFRPEAVLLDLALRGGDGLQLARDLRRLEGVQDTRLIAMTGYADAEHRHQAEEAGMDHFIAKPADLDGLQQLLQQTRQLIAQSKALSDRAARRAEQARHRVQETEQRIAEGFERLRGGGERG